MIAMNDFNFQTFVFITLILRIKSEQTTCPVCPPGSGLSLTKDDDPCHCRQCHSREYTRSSDNTCVPCDPSSCEDSMKRHTVSPCKPDANVVCGPCLSGYDEPGYGDPSEPCRKIDDNFPGVSHGPISTNIYEEPGNEATSSEPFQDIVEVFPKHNNDFIAIIGVIVLTAVIAWLVCKNVKKCLEKQCRFQYPFRYGSNLSATRVHAQASSDDELTHVTTGLLPHDQSSTATSVTHASPSYLGMDNLPSQASFTNVSVPPDDVGTGAPRQSNGAIVTVPPAADNSAPRLPNSSTVDQQPDTDNSSSPAMSNGSTETEQPGIGNSTPTLQHGTAIDHQHDANNSTRKQTLLSTEVTEQQRTERRQSEEQSCLHQSASVASRIDDASTCPPAAASAEALVANAGSEQPTADDTLKLKRREDTDMMSVASSMATRRQESQKTESDKDGNDQADNSQLDESHLVRNQLTAVTNQDQTRE